MRKSAQIGTKKDVEREHRIAIFQNLTIAKWKRRSYNKSIHGSNDFTWICSYMVLEIAADV
jgi:hypothetical protein